MDRIKNFRKALKAETYMEVTRELVHTIPTQLSQGSAPFQSGVFFNSSLRDSRSRSTPEIIK